MMDSRHISLLGLLHCSLLLGCSEEVDHPDEQSSLGEADQRIVNGMIDTGHEAVVRVAPLVDFEPCTGTLIGSSTVLTAAHCVHADTQLRTQMQAEVPVRACMKCPLTYEWRTGNVIAHPQYKSDGVDLALIRLTNATPYGARALVPGLAKILVQIVGQPITLVGFGQPDVSTEEFDVKRWGTNTIDSANNTYFYFSGVQGSDAVTCFGDSGGPAFSGGYTSTCVLGVTRGETGASYDEACQGIGVAYHTRLDQIPIAGWILSNSDSTVGACIPYKN
jgi:V8-like Glu-specific endopeptidase